MALKPSAKVIAKNESVKPKASASKAAPPITSVSMRHGKTEKSVSVRQISNGYIVSESTYGPKGYKSVDRFEAKPPTLQVTLSKAKK